jgi:hypothetical protein
VVLVLGHHFLLVEAGLLRSKLEVELAVQEERLLPPVGEEQFRFLARGELLVLGVE